MNREVRLARLAMHLLFPKPLSVVEDPDYNTRTMAIHFLRHIADGLERRYRIDPENVVIMLNFLYATQPDLRPKDEL